MQDDDYSTIDYSTSSSFISSSVAEESGGMNGKELVERLVGTKLDGIVSPDRPIYVVVNYVYNNGNLTINQDR